jgi:hypothetical protein
MHKGAHGLIFGDYGPNSPLESMTSHAIVTKMNHAGANHNVLILIRNFRRRLKIP